jgi:hypothetical protein
MGAMTHATGTRAANDIARARGGNGGKGCEVARQFGHHAATVRFASPDCCSGPRDWMVVRLVEHDERNSRARVRAAACGACNGCQTLNPETRPRRWEESIIACGCAVCGRLATL